VAAKKRKRKRLTKAEIEAFNRRSKAAKKGWRTKRKKALVKKGKKLRAKTAQTKKAIKQVVKLLPKKKRKKAEKKFLAEPKKKPKPKLEPIGEDDVSKLTKKELLERIRVLEARDEEMSKKLELAQTFTRIENEWPKLFGWTRVDGTFGVNYSSLRENPNAAGLWLVLNKAYEDGRLDWQAQEMAERYDVNIREVYTLFYSR
jgi:hypothetical protein